ncbi:MAG: iron ABC transporter permease [Sphingomonadales bacterium]|nr:iron ABC transporter permease [Sphingomonadales bacterium]
MCDEVEGAMGKRLSISVVFSVVLALLFAVPVISVVAHLLLPAGGNWEHLVSTVLGGYVVNSLILMVAVGLGTLLIGTGTAWLVSAYDFKGRRVFEWLLVLPLAVPSYVIAYAYTDFLQYSGPLQSLLRDVMGWGARDYHFWNVRSVGGAATMFVLVLYPYVYLLARASFMAQSRGLLDAARTLGAGPWRTFLRVAVPSARPALVAGVAVALMETLADYGAVSYFGVQTFTTGIYRAWFSLGDKVSAANLSSLLLGFVIILIMMEQISRRGAKFHELRQSARPPRAIRLEGASARMAQLAVALPVLFGFVLPALVLISMAIDLEHLNLNARYGQWVANTLILGVVTASLAVIFAVLISYAKRVDGGIVVRFATRLASLGYAIPGSIIAVGTLIPFAFIDSTLDHWARANLGFSTGLILTGTIAALVFAYLVRFMSVSIQTVEAGMSKITPSMDWASATLGEGRYRTMRRVHLPLLRPTLLTAFLLVMVDVMKELPATLIMRPFNFDTLAVSAHNFAADERLAEAAVPALTIVVVGLVPLYFLSRLISRSHSPE